MNENGFIISSTEWPEAPRGRTACRALPHRLLLLLLLMLSIFTSESAFADGSLEVMNGTSIPLTLLQLNGGTLGTQKPGEDRIYALPEGEVALSATRPDGSVYIDARLNIHSGALTRWAITPLEGRLEVRNNTAQALSVEVNEQVMGEVDVGKSLLLEGLRPGKLLLLARSLSGVTVQRTILELSPSGKQVWALGQDGNEGAGVPVLRVRNFSGERVDLFVNGTFRQPVSPGDSAVLVGFTPGELGVVARKAGSSEVVAETQLTFAGGELKTWTVPSPTGLKAVVEVNNRTPVALKICVDGAFCLKLKPQTRLQYDALTTGRHVLQAYHFTTGQLVDELDTTLAGGTPYQWDIEPTAATQAAPPARSKKALAKKSPPRAAPEEWPVATGEIRWKS